MPFGSPKVEGNPRQHINCGGSVTGSNSNHECGVACYDLVLTATKRNGDKLMDEIMCAITGKKCIDPNTEDCSLCKKYVEWAESFRKAYT